MLIVFALVMTVLGLLALGLLAYAGARGYVWARGRAKGLEPVDGFKLRPDAYYHRARAYILLGRDDEALADVDHAIELNAGFVPARILKSALLRKGGQPKAADLEDQALLGWQPSQGSTDGDLVPELPQMLSRSRDLVRNNGLAAGYVQTVKDSVLGHQLKLSRG